MSDPQPTPATPNLLLQNVIITLLLPFFLEGAGGDVAQARQAAQALIIGCGGRTPLELLFTAQAFAFGAAALAALNHTALANAPDTIIIRLRASANALNRTAERCWKHVDQSLQRPVPGPLDAAEHAELMQQAARAVRIAATPVAARPATTPSSMAPAPVDAAPTLVAPSAPAPSSPIDDASVEMQALLATRTPEQRAGWAAAYADVAQEMAACLADLPPQQRHAATIQIRALATTAEALRQDVAEPPAAPDPQRT
jgi:hypothetical protein